ncbi:MAG: response regulator transcription factor [Akkermansiaceae bacterium]|nr:response regulator transcription factor [Akkermansiaceae bacterium]
MKKPIRVMLVEDSRDYREVVELALTRDPGMELVSQFGTAEIALREIQNADPSDLPDLLLLDLQLPGMGGLDSLPWFRKYMPEVPVMVLTQSEAEADVMKAISNGAAGYLLKSSTVEQLKDAIRMVANGGASLDSGIAKYVLDAFKGKKSQSTEEDGSLTAREMEVLALVAEGFVKKEICKKLNISYNTVDIHVRHIYEKLEVQNAPAAVSKAYRTGLFPS